MTRTWRFSDGPTTQVSRTIAARPSVLWPHVIDIDLPARFSSELEQVEWLGGATEAAVGAEFRGTNRNDALGRWQVTCRVSEVDPERAFEWEVWGDGGRISRWRFTLEPVDGGTLVRQECELGPGPSGLTMVIDQMPDREHDIIERRLADLAANMQKNVDGLADLVER